MEEEEDGSRKANFVVKREFRNDMQVWDKLKKWIAEKYLNGIIVDLVCEGESVVRQWLGMPGEPEHFESADETTRKVMDILGIE